MKKTIFPVFSLLIILNVFSQKKHIDESYTQDYATKFELNGDTNGAELLQVSSDRNNFISIVSAGELLHPWEQKIVKDVHYPPFNDMNVISTVQYKSQIVYLTDKTVLSNAFAGKLYIEHGLKNPTHFEMADNFKTLIANKDELRLFENDKNTFKKSVDNLNPIAIRFDQKNKRFFILTATDVYQLNSKNKLSKVYSGKNLTAIAFYNNTIIIGTSNGFLSLDEKSFKASDINQKLPATEITSVENINNELWFGSTNGAFKLRKDGKFDYYASKRWVVDNSVVDIAKGPQQSVLILTKTGLSQIHFVDMTLEEKAAYFQEIQRSRHIRFGFTADLKLATPGDISSGVYRDTDNDGLWTSMYLASELYRYAVTKSEDAKLNAYEAFTSMERLIDISGISGFPARAFERKGVELDEGSNGFNEEQLEVWLKENGKTWQFDETGNWQWKVSTSSDESIGHFFVYALFAELAPDKEWRDRAIHLIKAQMDHLIENDWHLVTWNGKPTRWGNWSPEYVNGFPINVGDRRLNSTLILSFLQATYHFTGEEIYKEKAYELINEHGYDENANRPASVIQLVEGEDLSDRWNHSDDEMYFLSIPMFVNYSFTEEQKQKHFEAAQSHWEMERSENNPLWNFFYALTGGTDYDLEKSIWWLQRYPLDQVTWTIDNSQRQDLEKIEPNFRSQTYKEGIPTSEKPVHFHNGAYRNNSNAGGREEKAPHIWLLPYWMGRYAEAISAPSTN